MAGVLVGIEYGFDLFGIFVLAFLTALGGGLFRDIMLGNHPPVCFTHFSYIICVAITVVAFLIFLKVFDTHLGKEPGSEVVTGLLAQADAQTAKIADLKGRISDLRQSRSCPACQASCGREDLFCRCCGTAL